MQVRLHDSLSLTSSSTTSSIVPGIGYLSGKVIKWVGVRMLNALIPLEIRRRRWLIRKLIERINRIPLDEAAAWLVRKERKITLAVDNLLELSSYGFPCMFSTS
jgi:hypothetical protein